MGEGGCGKRNGKQRLGGHIAAEGEYGRILKELVAAPVLSSITATFLQFMNLHDLQHILSSISGLGKSVVLLNSKGSL